MSKIDTLVAELCPDGVEYKEIGDVLNYEQPTKYLVSSKDYSDDYATPVLTAGKTFILGYTSETDGIYPASRMNPVIIFDDFTTDFKWVDFPFKAKSSGMKMLTAADENLATIRYAYYAMQMISFSPLDHKRHWIGEYSHFEIPVPPIEVQREIVRILDTFTALTDTLSEELEARKAQYAYCRDRLLSRENLEALDGKPVEMKRLEDVAKIGGGHTPSKAITENYENGTIPWVTSKDVKYPHLSTTGILITETGAASLTMYPQDSIVVVLRSGILKRYFPVAMLDVPMTVNQDIKAIVSKDPSEILPRYLYHCIDNYGPTLLMISHRAGGTVDSIPLDDFKATPISVPSLATQQKVIDILDRFDALTSSLTDGIPAEIRARRQQYEYYRDRLLDFPRKAIGTE